jgi:DNA-binding NarL/FixJ family response regulator
MTDPRSIRIVIVDDHHMFRTGVRSELTSLAGPSGPAAVRLQIVGEAGAVESATQVITQEQPDVVLLDVHLPDGNGLSVAGELCEGRAVILTSSHDAADFADRLPASGACGFVPKGELSGAALSALLP